MLLLTIIGPQLLGTIRIVVSDPPDPKNWKQVTQSILMVVCSPLFTYALHLKMALIKLKLKLQPNDLTLVEEQEKLKRTMNMHVKLELGLETVYQLAGQTILLLLAITQTPTQSGLKTMFNNGMDPKTVLLLVLSIILSSYSCVSSHWRAQTACREHFPFMSRLTSGFFCLCGCLTRVTAIIMFFAGPLGLFSLLRHWQAEQYPWSTHVLDLFYPNGTLHLGDGEPFELELIDRWKKSGSLYLEFENGTVMRYNKSERILFKGEKTFVYEGDPIFNPNHLVSPPDYTHYTGVQLQYFLLAFFISIGLQVLVIFLVKLKLSLPFLKELNLLEKVIHCFENTNIPYNAKEWDDGKGDANEHIKRKEANWIEGLVMIIINGVFNTILLFPFCFLGK